MPKRLTNLILCISAGVLACVFVSAVSGYYVGLIVLPKYPSAGSSSLFMPPPSNKEISLFWTVLAAVHGFLAGLVIGVLVALGDMNIRSVAIKGALISSIFPLILFALIIPDFFRVTYTVDGPIYPTISSVGIGILDGLLLVLPIIFAGALSGLSAFWIKKLKG